MAEEVRIGGLRKRRLPLSATLAIFSFFAVATGSRGQTTSNAEDYIYQTGSPTFSTADLLPGGIGFINMANGNMHIEIPLETSAQRGRGPYTAALLYDSRVWIPEGAAIDNLPWTIPYILGGWRIMTNQDSGYFRFADFTVVACGSSDDETVYGGTNGFTWTDPSNTTHVFSFFLRANHSCSNGASDILTADGYALDASGLHMYVTLTKGTTFAGDSFSAVVYTRQGAKIEPYWYDGVNFQAPATVEDSNGNSWKGNTYLGGNPPIDTLGRQPLTISFPPNSQYYTPPTSYNVLNSKNQLVSLPLTWALIHVHTNFQVQGIPEADFYINVVHKIALPDGTSYNFTYDCDSTTGPACSSPTGQPGYYGLPTNITLPTGGVIGIGYSNFKDANGNTNRWVTSRTAAGGTWTYAPATNCGASCQTVTVTKPSRDQEVFSFTLGQGNGAWNTNVSYYSGSATGTPLETITTVYQSFPAGTFFGGFAYTLPQSTTTAIQSVGGTLMKKKTFTFDTFSYNYLGTNYTGSNGKLLSSSDYNFGTGAVGSLYRTTTFSYLDDANPSYHAAHILGLPIDIQIRDSASNLKQETKITYDSTPLTSLTGVANHDDTNFGVNNSVRGNPTLVQGLTGGTNYLTESTLYYDTTGQVIKVTDSAGNSTSFSYTDRFFVDGANPPQTFTPAKPTNAFATSVTLPTNWRESFGYYYGSGKKAYVQDQNGAQAYSHFLDSLDRLTLTYPPIGWVQTTYTSGTSGASADSYVSINDTTPSSSCSSCRHDSETVDAYGRRLQIVNVNDPDGADTLSSIQYDSSGRIQCSDYPYRGSPNASDCFSYDGLKRVTQLTHADGQATKVYYGSGVTAGGGIGAQLCSAATYGPLYPTLSVDETGKKRQIWSDAFARITEADEPDSTGNLTSSTCYQYDALGNLTQVVHGSQTRSYSWDALSRLTSVSTPETTNRSTTFAYTASGLPCSGDIAAVCQRTDPRGVVTSYIYDSLGRRLGISYSVPQGSTTSAMPNVCTPTGGSANSANACYYYDQGSNSLAQTQKGYRTSMSDVSGSSAQTYDMMGNVLTQQKTVGTITKNISQTYALDGSLSSVVYPSGFKVAYTIGNAERATSVQIPSDVSFVSPPAAPPEYAPQGSLASAIYGKALQGSAGITESRTYNNRLELSTIQASGPAGSLLNLSYNYSLPTGNNGNIASITDSVDSGASQSYAYDTLNRISSGASQATSGPDCWGFNFGIDPLGNLTSEALTKCSSGMLSVVVNGNNQISSSGFAYDANGNMTADASGFTYTYDGENRLTSASNGTLTVTSTYDGDGLRVRNQSGSSGAIVYFRDPSGQSITETDGSGTIDNQYVFFAGRRTALIDHSGLYYFYLTDHLGSTRALVLPSGTPCYQATFTPYGSEERKSGATCSTPYKFAGYERDSSSSLDYAFARFYNSQRLRFMSPDPLGGHLGDPQSLNRYAYALNNGNNLTDPTGLEVDADVYLEYWSDLIFGGGLDEFGTGGGSGFFNPIGWVYNPKTGNWGFLSEQQGVYAWLVLTSIPAQPAAFSPPTLQSFGVITARISAGTLDQLNDYCSARGRAKFIADWLPGGGTIAQTLWGSNNGAQLGFYQLSPSDLNNITEENSGGQTVAMHAASETLKKAAGSTTFLSWFRAATGAPKTLTSTWLDRGSVALIAADAGAGFYKEGKEILACQEGH